MNYPDSIYNEFEIVEKEIFGQKHYGLIKIYNIFGFKIRKHKRVDCLPFTNEGRICFEGGHKWHPYLSTVKSAIELDNWRKEHKFKNKVRK